MEKSTNHDCIITIGKISTSNNKQIGIEWSEQTNKQRWMCRCLKSENWLQINSSIVFETNNNNNTPSKIESTRLNCQMESKFSRPKPIPCFVFSIIIKYKLNGTKWQFHFINSDFISMLLLHMSTKHHYLVISKRKLL